MPRHSSFADLSRSIALLKRWRGRMVVLFLAVAIVGCNRKSNMHDLEDRGNEHSSPHLTETCSPTFLSITEEAIKVRIDPYLEMGATVILIGCGPDLQKIGPRDREELRSYFESVIEEHHYLLERKRLQVDFRNTLVTDINSLIGQERVSDVLIYDIYSKEFGPA